MMCEVSEIANSEWSFPFKEVNSFIFFGMVFILNLIYYSLKENSANVRFEVLTAMAKKNSVFK
jgi:hypothetical protein